MGAELFHLRTRSAAGHRINGYLRDLGVHRNSHSVAYSAGGDGHGCHPADRIASADAVAVDGSGERIPNPGTDQPGVGNGDNGAIRR